MMDLQKYNANCTSWFIRTVYIQIFEISIKAYFLQVKSQIYAFDASRNMLDNIRKVWYAVLILEYHSEILYCEERGREKLGW